MKKENVLLRRLIKKFIVETILDDAAGLWQDDSTDPTPVTEAVGPKMGTRLAQEGVTDGEFRTYVATHGVPERHL